MSAKDSKGTAAKEDTKTPISDPDQLYNYDEEHVDLLRKERPWDKNVKHFSKTKVSSLAAMKMLKHSLVGVKKGRASRNGMPVEVMGLLVGKPEGDSIIVTDACPIPVEGMETSVEAQGQAQVFMTQLSDSLELRRKDRFIGWYHSHPFDVDTKSNCFLSATDVQTQTSFQLSIPTWTAIVIDPLRSLARQEPEIMAFRIYPPAHNPPANLAPDGTFGDKEEISLRWGPVPHRYYSLEVSYFMSTLGLKALNVMAKSNLWVRVLSSTAMLDAENRTQFPERVGKAADKLAQAAIQAESGTNARGNKAKDALAQGVQSCSELAIEQCKGHCSQLVKDIIFNTLLARQHGQEQEHKQ